MLLEEKSEVGFKCYRMFSLVELSLFWRCQPCARPPALDFTTTAFSLLQVLASSPLQAQPTMAESLC
jgi:hypothetical protein